MRHLTVIIPSRNRTEKLVRCLNSIPLEELSRELSVSVGLDGNFLEAGKWYNELIYHKNLLQQPTQILIPEENLGSLRLSNLLASMVTDGVLCGIDDITFPKGFFYEAVRVFNTHFPNDDGVLGIKQKGIGKEYCPTGVCIIGQKFLQRYRNKWPFCPDYHHFYGDKEIHLASEALGRFVLSSVLYVHHYHPAFFRNEEDETHVFSRINMSVDKQLFASRQSNDKVWGLTDGCGT